MTIVLLFLAGCIGLGFAGSPTRQRLGVVTLCALLVLALASHQFT